ncbi:hypothetical protein JXA48_01830 [Candidatus Woesearchaeota archaeon]|nr:hypothetical protein [Candidatus Woesearchaeota archaeon]
MFNGYKSRVSYQGPHYLDELVEAANKGDFQGDVDDLRISADSPYVVNSSGLNTCYSAIIGAVNQISGQVTLVDESYLTITDIDGQLKEEYPELFPDSQKIQDNKFIKKEF